MPQPAGIYFWTNLDSYIYNHDIRWNFQAFWMRNCNTKSKQTRHWRGIMVTEHSGIPLQSLMLLPSPEVFNSKFQKSAGSDHRCDETHHTNLSVSHNDFAGIHFPASEFWDTNFAASPAAKRFSKQCCRVRLIEMLSKASFEAKCKLELLIEVCLFWWFEELCLLLSEFRIQRRQTKTGCYLWGFERMKRRSIWILFVWDWFWKVAKRFRRNTIYSRVSWSEFLKCRESPAFSQPLFFAMNASCWRLDHCVQLGRFKQSALLMIQKIISDQWLAEKSVKDQPLVEQLNQPWSFESNNSHDSLDFYILVALACTLLTPATHSPGILFEHRMHKFRNVKYCQRKLLQDTSWWRELYDNWTVVRLGSPYRLCTIMIVMGMFGDLFVHRKATKIRR